jgi:hypothetical protein
MTLFSKAINSILSRMSKRFKYVLTAGYIIFALQLVAIAALYIVYLTSSKFLPELKYTAEIITKNALSFITVVTIVCVTGDYIINGE